MRRSDSMPGGTYSATLHISKLQGLDYSKIIDIKSKYKRSSISVKDFVLLLLVQSMQESHHSLMHLPNKNVLLSRLLQEQREIV